MSNYRIIKEQGFYILQRRINVVFEDKSMGRTLFGFKPMWYTVSPQYRTIEALRQCENQLIVEQAVFVGDGCKTINPIHLS